MNRNLAKWGNALSTMASTILLMASSERVGAAIHRQWIKDLRNIANEIEEEMSDGKSSKRKD